MNTLFGHISAAIALALDVISVLLITIGAASALLGLARALPTASRLHEERHMYLRLARWLLLALEFTLAADVVRTAISPTWQDIGQLGAIAAIRTFLNYFLERDLERARATKVAVEDT
jgi:uncharacterized membrane protein